jgi:hypothetical protein
MNRTIGLAFVVSLLTAACSGNNGTSLTGPSNSIPNVAGSYSGSTTITFPEITRTLTCTTTTAVTQSGNTVNVAPLVLGGQCNNISVPFGQATLDSTGALNLGPTSGTYTDPSCGTYSYNGSGGFFGRTLQLSVSATSRTCLNFNLTVSVSH